MARTQQQRKADTRERLLRAAADLFAADGYHAVSIDAVADAADRTSGAVYAHFGGKEGLLLALLDAYEHATAVHAADAVADEADLDGRLAALWRTFARHTGPPDGSSGGDGEGGSGEPGEGWMLLEHELWLYAARNPAAAAGLAARYRAGRRGMAAAFAGWLTEAAAGHEAAAAGEAALDVDELATVVLALLFGLDMVRRVDAAAVPDDLARRALAQLFAGA